jgi:hypothetical protein
MEDLLNIIRWRTTWQGTYKELLDHIHSKGKESGIKSAKGMANLLKRHAPAFRAQGIEVEFLGRGRGGNRVHLYDTETQNNVHHVHTDEIPF